MKSPLSRLMSRLAEDGLVLAARAVVADEALAEARRVVADAAARAVAALRVAVAAEHVRARRALLERAVGAAEAEIAHAADVLHRVPRGRVRLARLRGELLLRVADTAAVAVVRADGTFACDAVVVVKAVALARLAVARALVRALGERVRLVGAGRDRNPRRRLRARAHRAVVLRPRRVAVRALVALALVVDAARAVARAPVRAVGEGRGGERGEEERTDGHCFARC